MPLPKEQATRSTDNLREPQTVKVTDISPCDEVKELPGGGEIKFPYTITIEDAEGDEVFNDKTVGTMKARIWNKKFWLRDGQWVAYTRDHALLAISYIIQAKSGEPLPKEVNLNKLLKNFEFDAVVVELDDGTKFIDWVQTFQHNGVPVPEAQELMPKEEREVHKSFDEMEEKPEKKAEASTGDGKLPWEK